MSFMFPFNPTIAILGDSITANNTSVVGGSSASVTHNANGYMTWLNILSGQRFNFPYQNNFGNSGDTLAQIAARVPQVIGSNASICIVHGGTNDLASNTLANMQNTMLNNIILPLLQARIFPVIIPILPRSSLTTAQYQLMCAFNNWLKMTFRETGNLAYRLALPQHMEPLVVDMTGYFMDYSAANGQPLANYTLDGLHPTSIGAFLMGYALQQALQYYIPPASIEPDNVFNYSDPVNNFSGNCLGTANNAMYGLFTGTSGGKDTNAGITPTGNLATGWNAQRASGSSTATMTLSKENPRTDILGQATGERQVVVVNATSAGSASEVYRIYGTQGYSGINPGDQFFAEVNVEVAAGASNFLGFFLMAIDGVSGGNSLSGASGGNLSQPLPNIAWKGKLRTPIVQTPGYNAPFIFLDAIFNASGGSAGATVKYSDFKVVKVQN